MEFREQVPLAPYTTFGIGGPARWFAEALTEEDVETGVRFAREKGVRLFVLGGGSNLLVSDEGYPGLVLRIGIHGISIRKIGERQEGASRLFQVGAGEDWDAFVALTVEDGCAGMECLSGIPGLVGGTPVQNVGAYGQEVGQSVTCVRALDRRMGHWTELPADACGFAYRTSIFNSTQRDRYIITRVDYKLPVGAVASITYPDLKRYFKDFPGTPSLADVRNAVRAIRQQKGMLLVEGDLDCRSAGSFFKNPVVPAGKIGTLAEAAGVGGEQVPRFSTGGNGSVKIPAAWLLDQAGFHKGYRLGAAGISSRHTLALTNRGNARAHDIVALRDQIRGAVEAKFGIVLEPEPVWVA